MIQLYYIWYVGLRFTAKLSYIALIKVLYSADHYKGWEIITILLTLGKIIVGIKIGVGKPVEWVAAPNCRSHAQPYIYTSRFNQLFTISL